MIQKIRKQFEQIRGKKHHSFDDFDPIIRRCLSEYAHLFPERQINSDRLIRQEARLFTTSMLKALRRSV